MIRINVKKALRSCGEPFLLDFSGEIQDKEFIAIFGKSGVGKTTLLRILAGLTTPESGIIEVNGDVWYDGARGICKKPQERSIGYVCQEYTLFPNMTVSGNIAYATPKDADPAFVALLIEMAELTPFLDRKPQALSGGQRQRVALVRALVRRPQLLLLDEPLSSLDADMRRALQGVIARIHEQHGITTCMVSHDITEVFRLSDRVYVMSNGTVSSHGKPKQIFMRSDMFAGNDIVAIEREGDAVIATVRIGSRFNRKIITTDHVLSVAQRGEEDNEEM